MRRIPACGTRPSLVDQVDRLVGEETVVDVAVGELRGRNQRTVGNRDPVVSLVAVTLSLERLDGL